MDAMLGGVHGRSSGKNKSFASEILLDDSMSHCRQLGVKIWEQESFSALKNFSIGILMLSKCVMPYFGFCKIT